MCHRGYYSSIWGADKDQLIKDIIPATPVWWSYKTCATGAVFRGATAAGMRMKAGWPPRDCPCVTAVQPRNGVSFPDALTGEGLEKARLCHLSSSTVTTQLLENCPPFPQAATTEQVRNRGQGSNKSPGIWLPEKTGTGITSRNLLNT